MIVCQPDHLHNQWQCDEEGVPGPDCILQGRLMNSESLANLERLGHLSDCLAELTDLIPDFQSLFSDTFSYSFGSARYLC